MEPRARHDLYPPTTPPQTLPGHRPLAALAPALGLVPGGPPRRAQLPVLPDGAGPARPRDVDRRLARRRAPVAATTPRLGELYREGILARNWWSLERAGVEWLIHPADLPSDPPPPGVPPCCYPAGAWRSAACDPRRDWKDLVFVGHHGRRVLYHKCRCKYPITAFCAVRTSAGWCCREARALHLGPGLGPGAKGS